MTCKHGTVTRLVYPDGEVWKCDTPNCKAEFIPVESLVNERSVYEVALDGIAGTMSAVLWDYSERMNEKYGLKPQETEAAPEDPCADGHDRDGNGICRVCNDNPFL